MTVPKISQAKSICDQLRARAVIVIAVSDDGSLAGCSYGETKMECRQTGRTLDLIIDIIESGAIPWL